MSFPINPTNGEIVTVNSIPYVYDATYRSWTRLPTANVTFGNIVSNSGTVSTSTTTGALVVAGGAGIGGALYIGSTGDVSANIGSIRTNLNTIDANLGTATTNITTLFSNAATQATSINTINANLGTATTNITTLFSNAATQATGINTINANLGAYQTYANTKIGTNTNSNLVVVATTTSTSTTTGALVVAGGAGIGGNVYTDKLYTTNGLYWAGNGVAFSSGGGSTLGFPNSTVATYPTGDYGDFTTTKDAFGVHIDTVYDCMEPIGSYSTVDLNT
jgi:hypothetical protein